MNRILPDCEVFRVQLMTQSVDGRLAAIKPQRDSNCN